MKVFRGLIVALFFIGFGILAYPVVSNEWNQYRQNQLIASYENSMSELEEADYSEYRAAAEEFNSTITSNNIYSDVFGEDDEESFLESDYYNVLNINGDGIMGYLSIPKINVKLSIYHGTSESVLQTGLGHLNGTSLPIGGSSNHAVIAGHRGLPNCELFTNIDQLEIGDMFYIHILGETLAYEVDQILPMVEADDMDTLSEALAIEEGKDYVTLFTCTPYGVNTHRLLVRGTRVEYLGEDEVATGAEAVIETARDYYMIIFICALILVLILIYIISRISKNKAKKVEEISEKSEI